MRLIDLLDQFEKEGTLGQLYQAGAVTLAYSHREMYNTYRALLASPRYADRFSKAAVAAAESCRVSRAPFTGRCG